MKYIAIIESSINWTEETNTVEEAVTMLRDLVETDKRYTFAGTTTFHWQSHGPNASKAMQVKWVWQDEQGKAHTMCKGIRIKDYTKKDERKHINDMDNLLNQWDNIVAMFK